ncbi:acetyltransferase component of pyruvate dehydrogenase complex [Vulcanimicrobium alpinum]|uniref:Acetyltransferase component of pyruvate dehydrogenase complex n=1 Tax=Vulcanimicrobium alpinum TaxID=3016050 RepID=A0AAN1XTM3_UNVUL|nr:dihydrolipoyllysine-residue acetyltransferase [Vulcanimicrobium alpinum]BDE05432.1 acetyltransferase component of pyruvate dehydrogenase complex [Vulcanimicrobium alpinum]
MAQVELAVPDLGGFDDVPVIEVLVRPGDTIAKDAPLVTLESDKATMEVPASSAGVVKDVRVKVGDKVSQGSVLVTVEADAPVAAAAATVDAVKSDPVGIVAAEASAAEEAGVRGVPAIATNDAPVDLVVPDIGDFSDIPIIEVLVRPGETIAKDAPLVTLESDKATMEVPAASGGVVSDVLVHVGDKVSKGTVIARLAATDGSALRQAQRDTAAPVSLSLSKAGPQAASSNGTGAATPIASGGTAAPPTPAASPGPVGPVHASPAIRRFARELGVDLSRVRGSGPNGRITRDDVQAFVKQTLAARPAAAPSAPAGTGLGLNLPPWPQIDFAKFGPVERVALSRIQKISGPVLARNWVMIPHVTQNDDADVTDLEAFRKQINGERKDVKVTMLAFLIKAVVAALKRYPQFNSSLDGDELVLKRYYNIGFAADTPNGLVVPVIKGADTKGVVEIARETSELAAKARDGKLGPADMSGATFTISSLGSIGGTTFTPIINAPEVAILGACKAEIRPVWDGAAFEPRLIQPLSLSYDHRVIDGANAARFVVELKATLADLRRTLL